MKFFCACRTDVGRVRTNNEDNFAQDCERGIFVVCDGMGGHSAGEVASKLAADCVAEELARADDLRARYANSGSFDDLLALQMQMREALATANRRIYNQSQKEAGHRGMGTTCTALSLTSRHKGILGHVGDSRLYLLRDKQLFQLTTDHTYVNELVKRGALSLEQAAEHPQGNILSRAMGVQDEVPIQTWTLDYDPQDTFFLCSDGIYNYFPQNEGLAELIASDDLAQGLSAIIDTALSRGGHDNCTGILLRVPQDIALLETPMSACATHVGAWPLFSRLTPLERLVVLGLGQRQNFSAGTTVIAPGALMEGLFLVMDGRLQLCQGTEVVCTLQAGQATGQHALLGPVVQPHALIAAAPTQVFHLSHRAFRHVVRQEPEIGSKLLAAILRAVGAVPGSEAAAEAALPEAHLRSDGTSASTTGAGM